MSEQVLNYGQSLELDFRGHTIRALMVNGVPWFALNDIGDALGLNSLGLDMVNHRNFPAFSKMVAGEQADPEIPGLPEDQVILSPVGVWLLTSLQSEPGRGMDLAAWSKREAERLCPDPLSGDRAMFLTLLEINGHKVRPPFPWRYSGRQVEWKCLRYSAAGIIAEDFESPSIWSKLGRTVVRRGQPRVSVASQGLPFPPQRDAA